MRTRQGRLSAGRPTDPDRRSVVPAQHTGRSHGPARQARPLRFQSPWTPRVAARLREEFLTAGVDGARWQQPPNVATRDAREAGGREHRPELIAALEWLSRAQDALGAGGVAAGYRPRAGREGWWPASPGATGATIVTWYFAARHFDRPELAHRAERAARWQAESQLASGAVQGGLVPTGQALLGWSSAFTETGWGVFAGAARRAGRFLVGVVGGDGLLRWGGGSPGGVAVGAGRALFAGRGRASAVAVGRPGGRGDPRTARRRVRPWRRTDRKSTRLNSSHVSER